MALAVLLQVLRALILHPHPLVVSLTRKRLLEPVEKLRGRVRLVVIVLSWSKATRDLLKSFGWGIRALHQLD